MNVVIVPIPHEQQRYNTAGDWFFQGTGEDETIVIRVSKIYEKNGNRNQLMEQLVAVHEYIEALLCKTRGITEEVVTEFDTLNIESEEPGNLPEAPYHNEHQFATFVESKLAEQLGVSWEEYDAAIRSL